MQRKMESLKSAKFKELSRDEMTKVCGGGQNTSVPNCSGGGGERKGFPEKGPNGTVRYLWMTWTSDDMSGPVGVKWEWGPYYTP